MACRVRATRVASHFMRRFERHTRQSSELLLQARRGATADGFPDGRGAKTWISLSQCFLVRGIIGSGSRGAPAFKGFCELNRQGFLTHLMLHAFRPSSVRNTGVATRWRNWEAICREGFSLDSKGPRNPCKPGTAVCKQSVEGRKRKTPLSIQ